MNRKYEIACSQVIELLKLIPPEQIKMIPVEVIKKIKLNARELGKVELKFDQIGNPILSDDAKIIILSLYKNYFLSEQGRIETDKVLEKNENLLKMNKKYNNVNDIF